MAEGERVLIELYLAAPPTFRCRRFIEIAEGVAAEFADRVTVRLYYRGRPVPVEASQGFKASAKTMGVPSLLVGGLLIASSLPPEPQRVKGAVREQLEAIDRRLDEQGTR